MTIAKKYRNIDEYAAVGIALAKAGHRNMWDAGDWLNAGGKQFGATARNRLVTQQGWKGYSRDALKTYGSIAKRFPKPLRYLNADCAHFQTVAPLSDALALPLLERAIHGRWTINRLRIEKTRATGCRRPLTGGDVVDDLATLIRDGRKFRAILADPPWQIYRTVGKRGASDSLLSSDEHGGNRRIAGAEGGDGHCVPFPVVSGGAPEGCARCDGGLGFRLQDKRDMGEG